MRHSRISRHIRAGAPDVANQGLADLTFTVRAERTRLTRCETQSPLTVQRALYLDADDPRKATVYLANPTAGLLDGDHHCVRLTVAEGARARITTQAATKVLSMSGPGAKLDLELTVHDQALLEYLPEPLIPFHGARLDQQIRISVSESGTLAYLDVIAPGRVAHGETFTYESMSWDLELARPGGGLLYAERVAIRPPVISPAVPGALGDGGALSTGTLLVVAPSLSLPRVELPEAIGVVSLGGAELPGGGGLVVKAMGVSAGAIREALLQVLRRFPMGDEPSAAGVSGRHWAEVEPHS